MTNKTKNLSFIAVYATVAGLFFINNQIGKAQTVEQEEPTVEQNHKNIQVLKGLPESQLMITMNLMRASLGVSCAYCHVLSADDKWSFEKDDKQTKLTARRMIQMTLDINKANFNGQPVVTCNTCHRGQTKPIGLPILPQTPPEGGAGGLKQVVALPTVDEVLNKYVQALGGRAAIEKIKTRMLKGSQLTWDGTALPLEIYRAAPDKFFSQVTMPRGLSLQVFDGSRGWIKNPRGERELIGEALNSFKRRTDFYESLKLKETFPNMSVKSKEKIADREVYLLESLVNRNETERLFFDVQSGLLVRRQTVTKNLLAPIPEQTDFEDYRDVDGVKLPFTIRRSFVDPWIGWTQKFTEVKQNTPIDDAKFKLPK